MEYPNVDTCVIHPYLPGISLAMDAEDRPIWSVDLSLDMFRQLYATDESHLSPAQRLPNALRRAAIAATKHIMDDDGGTCNFDSPVLYWHESGIRKQDAERAIAEVGLHCHEWYVRSGRGERKLGPLVICGFQFGQGNRHTAMAEAFEESLKAEGYMTGMYYQMD